MGEIIHVNKAICSSVRDFNNKKLNIKWLVNRKELFSVACCSGQS